MSHWLNSEPYWPLPSPGILDEDLAIRTLAALQAKPVDLKLLGELLAEINLEHLRRWSERKKNDAS